MHATRPYPPVPPNGLHCASLAESWTLASITECCAWRQIAEAYTVNLEADWFVLGNADTDLILDNLQAVLYRYDSSKPLYAGSVSASLLHCVTDDRLRARSKTDIDLKDCLSAGGIVLSRALMALVYQGWEHCLQQAHKPFCERK